MTKLNKRKSSFIIAAVALAILSTLLAAIFYMTGKRDVVVASAATEKFKPVIEGCKLSDTDNEDMTDISSIAIGYRASFETWSSYVKGDFPGLFVYEPCGYKRCLGYFDTSKQSEPFNEEEYNENKVKYITITSSKFEHTVATPLPVPGEEESIIFSKYYYFTVEPVLFSSSAKEEDLTVKTYISLESLVKEALLSDEQELSSTALKKFNAIAGNDEKSTDTTVILNYKQMKGYAETEDKSLHFRVSWYNALRRDYIARTLYNMHVDKGDGEYVSGLESFNAVYKDVKVFEDGTTGLISERIYLQANGYTHSYDDTSNTVTMAVVYKDFSYKDFAILINNNDPANPLKLYIYTSDVGTANGQTVLTFNYKTISEQLKNNAAWLVAINKKDFSVSGTGVGVIINVGDDALTVTFSDETQLTDIGITATTKIIEDKDVSFKYIYKTLNYDGDQPIFDEVTSGSLTIRYSALLDMNNERFYKTYGSIIDEALKSGIEDIKFAEYRGIWQGEYNETANSVAITVLYNYFTAFKIVDSNGNLLTYMQVGNDKLNYKGNELGIVIPNGFRVKSITSSDSGVIIDNNAENYTGTTIRVITDTNKAQVIVLSVEFTDKWKVRVEALENFTYIPESGADKGKVTASGFARKKIVEKEVLLSTFGDVYNPTEEELKNYLGFQSLTVIGAFGTWDKENTTVTFADDMYTIKMAYYGTTVQIRQSDGDTVEYVRIPLSCYAEWCDGFGKDWTIQALNYSYTNDSDTGDHVVFKSEGDVKREDLYGYFYVAVFREKVVNLDSLFAGYNADGCRVFYKSKEVRGDSVYRFFSSNQWLLPTIGGTVGLLFGHPVVGAAIGTAAQYTFMSIEEMNSDTGTFYSYFSFVDGSSSLPYAANNKAEDAFDDDSGLKNTIRHGLETIKEFFDEKIFNNPKLKYIFWVIVGLLAYAMLTCAFNKMGINTGIYSYIWLGICAALIAVAIYFGITIFIL